MTDSLGIRFFQDLLDSFKCPVLFADTGHIIRYMNRAAVEFYPGGGNLLGCSLLDCHNQISQQQMITVLRKMEAGLDEELITDNAKRRIYMRSVRDRNGELLGYFERFELPRGGE